MYIQINGKLTNGMWANAAHLAADNKLGLFILGALDRGYAISIPGAIQVTAGKWKIYTHFTTNSKGIRWVNFMHGKIPFSDRVNLEDFTWDRISFFKGHLYIDHKLVK